VNGRVAMAAQRKEILLGENIKLNQGFDYLLFLLFSAAPARHGNRIHGAVVVAAVTPQGSRVMDRESTNGSLGFTMSNLQPKIFPNFQSLGSQLKDL